MGEGVDSVHQIQAGARQYLIFWGKKNILRGSGTQSPFIDIHSFSFRVGKIYLLI